jgi:hypothetical protein
MADAPPTLLDVARAIFGDCISHEHEQVGRCVYCKTCGRRLYQGTVAGPDEIAALREALALEAAGG